MATVTGVQVSDTLQPRRVVLRETLELDETGTSFQIPIPSQHLAPTGRRLEVEFEIDILTTIPSSPGSFRFKEQSEELEERVVVLKGQALMDPLDDILLIPIPAEHQAAAGRVLKLEVDIEIIEEVVRITRAFDSGFDLGFE